MVVCIIILVHGGEKRLIYGVWWLEFAEKVVGKMLIGQYEHSIDAKGRMNFPAKFREDLGDSFIITKGLKPCVAVYSMEGWKAFEEKVNRQPEAKAMELRHFYFASATEVEPDRQGRIVIPSHLRDYAGLEKEVLVIGTAPLAEIWNKNAWKEYNSTLTAQRMMETLDSLKDF